MGRPGYEHGAAVMMPTEGHWIAANFKSKPPIGGWLLIPSFWCLVSPILSAYYLFDGLGNYSSALPAANKQYFIVWGIAMSGLLAANVWAAVLLLQRSQYFPAVYVSILAVDIVAAVAFLSWAAIALKYTPTEADTRDLIRTIAPALVWGPYMLISKRARWTFGWPEPDPYWVPGELRPKPFKAAPERKRRKVNWRIVGIWFFGLFGACVLGALVGEKLSYNSGLFGALSGMALFTCARLWLGARRGDNGN